MEDASGLSMLTRPTHAHVISWTAVSHVPHAKDWPPSSPGAPRPCTLCNLGPVLPRDRGALAGRLCGGERAWGGEGLGEGQGEGLGEGLEKGLGDGRTPKRDSGALEMATAAKSSAELEPQEPPPGGPERPSLYTSSRLGDGFKKPVRPSHAEGTIGFAEAPLGCPLRLLRPCDFFEEVNGIKTGSD